MYLLEVWKSQYNSKHAFVAFLEAILTNMPPLDSEIDG